MKTPGNKKRIRNWNWSMDAYVLRLLAQLEQVRGFPFQQLKLDRHGLRTFLPVFIQ